MSIRYTNCTNWELVAALNICVNFDIGVFCILTKSVRRTPLIFSF
ncbi:hypothetical protein [Wolbachia pipientis]